VVPLERPRLSDADQPDLAKSDDGGEEAGGEEVDFGVIPINMVIWVYEDDVGNP
jgi:hypothetical protein